MLAQVINPWHPDLWMLRSDTSGVTGGNKAAKLAGYIDRARREGIGHLVTMAGARSNHLRAFAALCQRGQLQATAFIRGDELNDPARHSDEIRFAVQCGVRCHFLARGAYRHLRELQTRTELTAFLAEWDESLAQSLFIPEGGLGPDALPGVAAWAEPAAGFEHVFVACGTGATAAGILCVVNARSTVHAVAALKNSAAVRAAVSSLAGHASCRLHLVEEFAEGRFGPWRGRLSAEATDFLRKNCSVADTVYTPRVIAAIEANARELKGRVLFVYTYNE